MQIVELMGGLGNQMFQYAFAKALENHTNEKVYFDLFWYQKKHHDKNHTERYYGLDKFNCDVNFINRKEALQVIYNLKTTQLFPESIYKAYGKLKSKFIKNNIIYEKTFNIYQEDLLSKHKNAYYHGCFQSEKYFKSIRSSILQDFTLKDSLDEKNTLILESIQSSNSVSLHIRRGDYLKVGFDLCSLEYYHKAIEYLSTKFQDLHFYIFSDDQNWVKENLKIKQKFTAVEINSLDFPNYDLWLMKHCRHNIISNSTFSWWGAWLNQNPDKIVITPKIWFHNIKIDIIPEEWIRI